MWKLILIVSIQFKAVAIEDVSIRGRYMDNYDYTSLESCNLAGKTARDNYSGKYEGIHWTCVPSRSVIEE